MLTKVKTAVLFGVAHYVVQMLLYVIGFALGPGTATRRIFGVSLYDVLSVLTFPVIYLMEKFDWSGLGLAAFVLNSFVWASAFYCILIIVSQPGSA